MKRSQSQRRVRFYGRAKIRRCLKAKYGDGWSIMRRFTKLVKAHVDVGLPRFETGFPASWKFSVEISRNLLGVWAMASRGDQ